MEKKMNNKGFSLVELIIVIAIMAVLMGVLAPQYLKYVESSRLQKDNTAIGEIANSLKMAMSDEALNKTIAAGASWQLTATGTSYAIATSATAGDSIAIEIQNTIGDNVDFSSNTYQAQVPTIVVSKDATNGNVTVYASGYYTKPGVSVSGNYNF